MYAIEAKNMWKKYKIGRPKTLTHAIPLLFSKRTKKEFWALRSVSFRVRKGETLGIIGPNGSGKSTLLKIISQITTPTRGSISVRGRVASLLELGSGFHPELSGKENIYLYGSILGIKKEVIDRNFNQIVSFSGVKKFIDTPVKHYSSGMYVRLAFSVAIHLDWEIFLIDEVLSVGDVDFQKKSLTKIEQLSKEGKTMIIVSHNNEFIKRLCTKALFLDEGRIEKEGKTESIIDYYLANHHV